MPGANWPPAVSVMRSATDGLRARCEDARRDRGDARRAPPRPRLRLCPVRRHARGPARSWMAAAEDEDGMRLGILDAVGLLALAAALDSTAAAQSPTLELGRIVIEVGQGSGADAGLFGYEAGSFGQLTAGDFPADLFAGGGARAVDAIYEDADARPDGPPTWTPSL